MGVSSTDGGRNNPQDFPDAMTHRQSQTETACLLPASSNDNEDDTAPKTSSSSFLLSWLVVATWISGILFGLFALLHYLRAAISCSFLDNDDGDDTFGMCIKSAWDRSDPNLYRPTIPIANRLMIAHLMGGVVLMFAGPIQFLANIRRHYMSLHRWMGRIYLVAALAASVCATLWTLIWHTSRCNLHEDVGNVILGTSVFVSALQTYRHVKITRRIDLHQLWAWRLYACILGAPLYRLYAAIYGAFLIYTPWNGSLFVEDATFYIIVIPNLIVVEIIWRRKQQPGNNNNNNLPSRPLGIKSGADAWNLNNGCGNSRKNVETGPFLVKPIWIQIALVFISVMTGLLFFYLWLPTILGTDTGVIGGIYHDFCESKKRQ